MLIRNDTPFAATGFGDLHRDGMTMAVVCVRGSYNLLADGALQLANHQGDRVQRGGRSALLR